MDRSAVTSPTAVESPRGRRRTREQSQSDHEGDENSETVGADGVEGTGSSRKRRRSRKGLDKKFVCPHETCNKSYSRAEHLYRHQLNHNPKQIYQCDFPDCQRTFVRQDLCTRHKERHTAKGSHLQRKDSLMHAFHPLPAGGPLKGKVGMPANQATHQPTDALLRGNSIDMGTIGPKGIAANSPISGSTTTASAPSPVDSSLQSPHTDIKNSQAAHQIHRSQSDEMYQVRNGIKTFDISSPRHASSYGSNNRTTSFGSIDSVGSQFSPTTTGQMQHQPMSMPTASSSHGQIYPPNPSTYAANSTSSQNQAPAASNSQYASHPTEKVNQHSAPSAMPGTVYGEQSSVGTVVHEPTYGAPNPANTGGESRNADFDGRVNHIADEQMLDQMGAPSSMPVFGGEGFGRSPVMSQEDFALLLYGDSMGYNMSANISPALMGGSATVGLQAPYFGYDPVITGQYTQPAPVPHPMALNSIIDASLPEASLSEEKRSSILDLIYRFTEMDQSPVKKRRDVFFEGDHNDPSHVFSLSMMQTYIGSYWLHFHQQMPILHRPTFAPENCHDLLLIAMIAIGAACLEKTHGHAVTTACAELSNFLAWHLRWHLFQDAAFRPPAKLWVFQALLLLEIFEKMYSSRPLHERAHIHHATTLTLMRRGSSLIGRSALDSPPSVKDGARGSSFSASGPASEWWDHWINNEGTRRVAFAAFVMDSTHATMFGHSAVMVAHEMRLPLPCDEYLWAAKSSAEVGRAESSLQANGVKPITFLEGLKRTLNGKTVTTNSFGRVIIMAGLLSVSWHMNQRDLQVSSLGVSQALGGRDKWKGSLTRAFDFWKRDFDESLAKTSSDGHNGHAFGAISSSSFRNGLDDDNIFEARTVLHHLAHMAMHVDVVDCQIFAGATRLLGRSITRQDYEGVQGRMRNTWAPSARARDATFYALRFLSQVLIPEDHESEQVPPQRPAIAAARKDGDSPPFDPSSNIRYSARDDFLLNRPWVLYYAALIVWSYGYALDGPIVPHSAATTGKQIDLSGGRTAEQNHQRSQSKTVSPARTAPPAPEPRTFKMESPGPQAAYSVAHDWTSSALPHQPYQPPPPQHAYVRPSQQSSGEAGEISVTPSHPIPQTPQQRVLDMQSFLRRVGGVRTPEDLIRLPDRNGCLGMLLLLRDMFYKTRWELLHEASNLLGNCCEMLVPGSST
ncbi:MAG: hypothetical protein M1822_004885 [Bathelium mastoideum]|nr:MAG: hypothetical protein M1822_004885 [Bathelium mastoideum]